MKKLSLLLTAFLMVMTLGFAPLNAAEETPSPKFYGYFTKGGPFPGMPGSQGWGVLTLPTTYKALALQAMGSVYAGAAVDDTIYAYTYMDFFGNTVPMELTKFVMDEEKDTVYQSFAALYNQMEYFYEDLTYDYARRKMYALGKSLGSSQSGEFLFEVELHPVYSEANPSPTLFTNLGRLPVQMVALASDYSGNMFAISVDGDLWSIDPADATGVKLGSTDVDFSTENRHSMAFNHETGILYWSPVIQGPPMGPFPGTLDAHLYSVNTITGKATSVQQGIAPSGQVVALSPVFTVAQPAAPAKVGNLTYTLNNTDVEFSWTNPSKTFSGATLTAIAKVEISRDGEVVATITDGLTAGAAKTHSLTSEPEGLHSYTVVAYSDENIKGEPVIERVFVGLDKPAAPANLKLDVKNNTEVTLTWEAPTKGMFGGNIDAASLKYRIERAPDGVVVDELEALTYTTTITELNNYTFTVIPYTAQGDGTATVSVKTMIGNPLNVPYYTYFENSKVFSMWTVLDVNKDFVTWYHGMYDGDSCAVYRFSDIKANDWMMSPKINLEKGAKYRVKFAFRTGYDRYIESLRASVGKTYDTVGRQIIMEKRDYPGGQNLKDQFEFSVSETGTYNLSMEIVSVAERRGVYLKQFSIEKVVEKDLEGTLVTGRRYPTMGKEYTYQVTVHNNGTTDAQNFDIKLVDETGTVYSSTSDTKVLKVDSVRQYELTLNGTAQKDILLSVQTVLTGDENPDNDRSRGKLVKIQDEYTEYTEITKATHLNNSVPAGIGGASSVSQVIFYKDELNVENGVVKSITLTFDNANGQDMKRPFEFWLTNTDLDAMTNTWIPEKEFVKVYEGEPYFYRNKNSITINFTEEFVYNGGNLCLMTVTPYKNTFYGSYFDWYSYQDGIHTARTLYWTGYEEFNFGQKGTLSGLAPIIDIQFNHANGGKLSGTISSNKSWELDGKVMLEGQGIFAKFGADGKYSFDYLPLDNVYDVAIEAFGHRDTAIPDIAITAATVLDVKLTGKQQYTITGTIKDVDGNLVKDAQVRLNGYYSKDILSDAQGKFEIQGVFADESYTLTIFKENLQKYSIPEFTMTEDKNFDIVLSDILFKPINVTATKETSGVDVAWDEVSYETEFRWDNGISDLIYGAEGGSASTVLGTVYRENTEVTSASWMTFPYTKDGVTLPHATVNLYIFDLDAKGLPTTTVLFSKMNIANKDSVWMTYTFDIPVKAPRGFMVALSYEGYLGLVHDTYGADSKYPFRTNTHYFNSDYTKPDNSFTAIENFGFSGNLFLRATGHVKGMIGFDATKAERAFVPTKKAGVASTAMDLAQTSVDAAWKAPELALNFATKSLQGYRVWRFLDEEASLPGKWVPLTPEPIQETSVLDENFYSLAPGFYRYGVRAIYSEDYVSDSVVSNIVENDMFTAVNVTVKTNIPNEAGSFARIKLTNTNDNPDYVYQGIADDQGKWTVEKLVKGTYNVEIALDGFEKAKALEDLTAENSFNLEYTLKEIIEDPFNLSVTAENGVYNFVWNSTPNIVEDFESHADFAINSAGEIGWSYIDGDGQSTYGINNTSFPGSQSPMAFMVFNPSATTPALEDPNFAAFGGEKYLMGFASVEDYNNDFIISPELKFAQDFKFSFQAKALSGSYEQPFRVGYSESMDTTEFTYLGTQTLPSTDWGKYTFTIPAKAKYVFIKNVAYDAFGLMIDDIFIGLPEQTSSNMKGLKTFEVYLNGEKRGETTGTNYQFSGLNGDTEYTAGVKAIYGSGSSNLVTIKFQTTSNEEVLKNVVSIRPNPAVDRIQVDGEYERLEIVDLSGSVRESVYAQSEVRLNLNSGVYFVKIYHKDGSVKVEKLVIKR